MRAKIISDNEEIAKANLEITAENRKILVDTITNFGRIDALEMPFTAKNGDIVHAIINAERIQLNGKYYLLSIGTDITARKKAESALTKSEKRFANAIAATSDAIWEWDLVTKELFFSPRWFQMLGFENNGFEVDENTMRTLCHPDDYDTAIGKIRNSIMNSVPYLAEFRMKSKNNAPKNLSFMCIGVIF